MKHDIAEKDGTVVGFAEVLEDKDLSITFHGVWVGVFSTFEAWNCQHGGAYMLVVDATKTVHDFQLLDISLVGEDLGDVDDQIVVTHSDDDYDYGYIQWDTCNLKDDPVAFIQHAFPNGEFTLHEFQKQFLQQIADATGIPRKYLK